MFETESQLQLTELIDIKFLQEFQDIFAKTLNIACLTTDDKKAITKPSNYSSFCQDYMRTTDIGAQKCSESDIKWGKVAAAKKEPVIYTCHAGLTSFAVPIIVNDKHIGTILGGQVLTEEIDEERFRGIARQYGINENEYIDAIKKIQIIPMKNLEVAISLLQIITSAITEIGQKKIELNKKNKQESLYRNITEVIRSTLDIDDAKERIVNIIGKTLNADRCFIIEFDQKKEQFLPIKNEYLSSEEVSSYFGADILQDVPVFASMLKKGQTIIINNGGKELDGKSIDYEREKIAIEKHKVISAIAIPFYYADQLIGAIAIHYVSKAKIITEDEIVFLKLIANQIAIALHQGKLYNLTRIQAEREKVNRNIVEVLRSTLDKNTIKNIFVNNIGEYFEADRVLFSEFNEENNMYDPVDEYSEYLSGNDVRSYINYDWRNPQAKDYIEPLIKKQEINITNWDEYIKENEKSQDFITLFEEAGVKSSYNIIVMYRERIMGYFCIEYTHSVHILEDEDLKTIRNICKQAGIALYHAELYAKIKQTAERETLLRNIIEEMRKTLNIEDILTNICNEVLKSFNCGRVSVIKYFKEDNSKYEVKRESRSKDEYTSIKEVYFPSEVAAFWNKKFTVDNLPFFYVENIEEADLPEILKDTYLKIGLKTLIGIPIKKGDDLWGGFWLSEYEYVRKWSDDDIKLLQTLAGQIYITIEQAESFEKQRKQVERETLIRNILEKIRSSLDVEDVLSFICSETAKLFNVQRTGIAVFPNKEDFYNFKMIKQYTSIPEIKIFSDINENFKEVANYWGSTLVKQWKVVAIDNIEQSDTPDYFKALYKEMGVKSIIGTLIKKGNDFYGTLILAEYNEYRKWSEEEITLLETISSQIYIAINQAELFENTKKTLLEKAEFITNISLDLKNPLNTIIEYSELLSKSDFDRTKEIEYLKTINNNALEALSITNEIVKKTKA